jgi:hypothetical protein
MDTEEDKEESSKKKLRQESPPATAASLLTDDLILEVLSHLPARSVRRFKCVSTAWRDLIADPAHRKKLPQTLAGFLYNKYKPGGALSGHFASVSDSQATHCRSTLPSISCNLTSSSISPLRTPAMAFFSAPATTRRLLTQIRMNTVMSCAILPRKGGSSCPLHLRLWQTDFTVPHVWLSIRQCRPISTFFNFGRPFRVWKIVPEE